MAEEILLSKEQVDVVTQFANELYTYDRFGYFSPFLSNQLMQELNNNPKMPTTDSLRKALSNYKENAQQLQGYMEYTKFYDMLFARTIQAYVNSLSFDLQMVCTNAYTAADYESAEYIDDKRRVYDFLNKFNYKNEFRKIVQQIVLNEVYYVSFRKTKWGNHGMKFALQTLPQDRCMLDGYWEKGLLFSFDMGYFLQAGADINLYDPSMKVAYNRVFNGKKIEDYIPSAQLDKRDGVYSLWTQLSPNDGYWAFKMDMSNFNVTPFLAPYLKNALTNDEIEQLQRNKDMAEAYGILAGEIATFDTAKSGTQQDQLVFNPTTLAKFMKIAKSGLSSAIKLAALPVKNLDFYQFEDKNTDMYANQLRTSSGIGIGAGRLLYATDRMSNAEVESALNEIYQTMKPLYYQFGNFLDYNINKLTKKYCFKFIFDGSNYGFERSSRLDRLSKLADKGIVLNSSAWASVLGYEPQVFDAMLAESKHCGWTDNLQLLMNTNTTNQSTDGGRPTMSDDELSDSGEANRDQ